MDPRTWLRALAAARRTLGFALALALGAAASNAHAAIISIDLSSGQASFDSGAPLFGGGDDVLTFTDLAPGTYDYVFSVSTQFIAGFGGTVNGTPFATAVLGPVTAGGLFGTADGPFTVVLSGAPISGRAIYSGEFTVTPVGASVPNAPPTNTSIDLSSGQASFDSGAPLLEGGDDVFTFTGVAPGTYDYVFSVSTQFIAGFHGTVNGTPFATAVLGPITVGALFGTADAPLTVALGGAPISDRAIYSGEVTLTDVPVPVPEPGSLALLAMGLGLVGLRRRR